MSALNQLERQIVARFLADPDIRLVGAPPDLDAVEVTDRAFSGVGFMTDVRPTDALRIVGDPHSIRWRKVGARLNARRQETGYIVYVDDGHVTGIEGFVYGPDPWPEKIETFELVDLHLVGKRIVGF